MFQRALKQYDLELKIKKLQKRKYKMIRKMHKTIEKKDLDLQEKNNTIAALQEKNFQLRTECELTFREGFKMSTRVETMQKHISKCLNDLLQNPEEALRCPITQSAPCDGMALCTCTIPHAFEFKALERWLQHSESCPYSRDILQWSNVTVFPKAFCDNVNEIQTRLVMLQRLQEEQRRQKDKQEQAANALVALSEMSSTFKP